MLPGEQDLTSTLKAAGLGDEQAAAQVFRVVYAELRNLAKAWMNHTPPGQTLQPTALVHETYVRLMGREPAGWESRAHFFFAASRAMRDILVENARSKARLKRGGGRRRVDLENLSMAIEVPDEDLLALDDVLQQFESQYPREHRIVMLRFFAGMTNEQTARVIDVPLRTVERDWRFARAWLRSNLQPEDADPRSETQ